MKDNENKNKASLAIVGFVAGVLTVVIIVFVMKGC
jgi:hypothetical protein